MANTLIVVLDNDVYIWLEEDAPINEVTFISEGVEVTLPVNANIKSKLVVP